MKKLEKKGRERASSRSAAVQLSEATELIRKRTTPSSTKPLNWRINLAWTRSTPTRSFAGTVVLPHGLGKSVRVAGSCKGEKQREATKPAPNS